MGLTSQGPGDRGPSAARAPFVRTLFRLQFKNLTLLLTRLLGSQRPAQVLTRPVDEPFSMGP